MNLPNHKSILAPVLVAFPVAASAAAPPLPTGNCPANLYATTQTAQRQLGVMQRANSALMQTRNALGGPAGIGGLLSAGQSWLGAAQQEQAARQPTPTYCRPAAK